MGVKLREIVEELNFEIVHQSSDYREIEIQNSDINRPGLQLCGYYSKFVKDRIQLIGTQEWHYINSLDDEERYSTLEKLFKYNIPVVVFSRDNEIFLQAKVLAEKHNVTILRSPDTTSKIFSKIISFVDEALAPTTRMHGVLLDISGIGVLITGRSGIGKSETALDLISNGARLISDDSVIIKNIDKKLIGKSPDITKYFMEIRGVGIIDIQKMFGIGFVMEEKAIEVVVNLEDWDESKEYERLGVDNNYQNILGIDVVKFDIPVKPGRHTALIIEVATKNYKQKELGYNPALALNERMLKKLK
ncbi:HPr(Ser) kinase/phosphatase [Peptoniphilus senegalensis]|uniref:HPr(Ser) kinase/phosphatase n=1 Tax=Peptoniphilus senegalensis TaxID=1465757 RepID=UPI0002D28F91|nr:HPr(Ser) kinase/phosphatase [Peptoniphilus senegalensis]